ncbi:MAG: PASTA domain-containing protein [Candidatus Hydrogenedentales bacterium]|jgi:beta-lactam-binding protein with PASTA domain/PKD repeat protein
MRKMVSVFLASCLLAGLFSGDALAALTGDGQSGGGTGISRRAGGPTTYGDDLSPQELAQIELMLMDSPPIPPAGEERPEVTIFKKSATLLPVPTSTWTYGCSPTSAGMIFGYFDRNGWPNIYTGPTNNGVAPLTNLGQGIYSPIAGSCSLIATQNGFDGRSIPGHVDDYWVKTNAGGPDPWVGVRAEHVWEGCTADFMGTNQWKWDTDRNGEVEKCRDGLTCLYSIGSGARLYDYVPPSSYGFPQTALCHGMRLFAESRGYTVLENYTQLIDALSPNGFSFADYKAEIDAGWPVMIQVVGHSMVGVGYDDTDNTVYLHDTWDNKVHSMTWGGSYAGMVHRAVTVIHLERPSSLDAQFNASPLNGFAPLNVQFADQSTGSPTAWYWDFGDGYTSTRQHPSHVYASPGSYSVSLTVTDASGSDTAFKADYISLAAAVIEISSLDALQRIGIDPGYPLDGDYMLTQDIDASATAAWNGGAGFEPLGPFSGNFDGQGYLIANLTIYRPSEDLVGLFGTIGSGGVVENLGLVGAAVTGKDFVGGLAGYVYEGTISGCHVSGSIAGEAHIGGLAGYNEAGALVASCATGPVSGDTCLGGLAGTNDCGVLSNSYATGPVTGTARAGGLVGNNPAGFISACYATGAVSGSGAQLGGLVGQNGGGVVEYSFWDVETSGITQSDGGTGLSTAQMETQSTFARAGWDFSSVWYMLAGGSYPYLVNLPLCNVPPLVGLMEADAATTLEYSGFSGRSSYAYSSTTPAGRVMNQRPAAMTEGPLGSPVGFTVSLGEELVSIPNVAGEQRAVAELMLALSDLSVGTVTQQYSNTVPAGQVIGQSPAAGAQVAPGSAVNLVISKGVQPIAVPSVVGKTQSAAGSALTAAGLTVGTVTQQYSNTVPAGQVIGQSPVAGAQVAPGSAVNLVISKGVQPIAVPSVVGKTQSAAGSALTAAGLTVGTATQQYSNTVPAGQVIDQSPAGGAQVAPGSTVNLVISKGVQPVSVPSVVGKTQSAAGSALTAAGLTVGTVTQQYSNTVPAGQVIDQSPAGGAQVAPGSTVNLVISKGVQPVAVPNVVGKTETEAISALVAAGLTVGIITQQYSNTVPAGQVIGQSPAAGAQVAPGSAVNLVISKGVQPVSVPSVVGKTETEAISALVAAGLTVGNITQQYSNTVPAGMVIAQDPAPSETVVPGSPIHLSISLGRRVGNLMVNISKLRLTFGAPSASFSIINPQGEQVDWHVESETDRITIQPAAGSGTGNVTVTGVDFSNTENSRLIVKNLDNPNDVAYIQLVLTRPGDINGDNVVNAMDIQLVVNAVLESSSGLDCDINGDGRVNAIDVQLVVNNALGL